MPIATLATLEETEAYRKRAQFWLDKQGGIVFASPSAQRIVARAAIGEFLANQDGKTLRDVLVGEEMPSFESEREDARSKG